MSAADGGAIRLATRGDDAGLTDGTNRAILEAFETGILRNASVMAPAPALESAAEHLAGVEGLCIGVHLTLTAEWDEPRWGPVLPADEVPSLLDDDGTFPRTAHAHHDRDASVDEMVAEAEAQLDRIRSVGFEPAYLDCHMGVDWVGDLADELDRLREREGLLDGDGVPRLPGRDDVDRDSKGLLARLDTADAGAYRVVGHPAYADDERMRSMTRSNTGPGEAATRRDAQRRMFLDESVRQYCADHAVEPVRFADLPDAAFE